MGWNVKVKHGNWPGRRRPPRFVATEAEIIRGEDEAIRDTAICSGVWVDDESYTLTRDDCVRFCAEAKIKPARRVAAIERTLKRYGKAVV